MASALAISKGLRPSVQLSLVTARPVKFDAAFLDRRMHAHHMWQNRVLEETTEEVLRECLDYVGERLQKIARQR
jgi:hypothetical protein